MAKDPAFLFYPGDWLGGTMTFSRSHKGAYMDLLMVQFNNGHMSLQDVETVLGGDFQTMWEYKLKAKFLQDEKGLYYNQKLEDEVNKRRNFTDSRKKNLNNKTSHMEAHTDARMENGNENENKDKKENRKRGAGEKPKLNFGSLQDSFSEKWETWIKFKKEQFKQSYKTPESEQLAINSLIEISKGDYIAAEKIINQSISNLWKGLFKLKENTQNGKSTTGNTKEPKFGRVPVSDIERFMQSEIPVIFKRNPDLRGDNG